MEFPLWSSSEIAPGSHVPAGDVWMFRFPVFQGEGQVPTFEGGDGDALF